MPRGRDYDEHRAEAQMENVRFLVEEAGMLLADACRHEGISVDTYQQRLNRAKEQVSA